MKYLAPSGAITDAGMQPAPPFAILPAPATVTAADLVTLTGYGLGLWWALGGPSWAGIASVVADEVDGRIARASGTTTLHGSSLDWGADVALTPFALYRLGVETGHPTAAMVVAPPVLLAQSMLRANEMRPPIGSARAVVTLAAIAVHEFGGKRKR